MRMAVTSSIPVTTTGVVGSSYTVPSRSPGVKTVSGYRAASAPAASRASPVHSVSHPCVVTRPGDQRKGAWAQ